MEFGDIFFFIIFIIIVASNVYTQVKKARLKSAGGEASVKKPGWKNALEQILEEARKQMENQGQSETANAPAGSPSGWEEIMGKKETEASQPEGRIRPENNKPGDAKPMDIRLKRSQPVKLKPGKPGGMRRQSAVPLESLSEISSDTLKEKPVKSKPVVVEKDYYAVAEDKTSPQQLSREALRNAVVWAEILAPPVGLRGME